MRLDLAPVGRLPVPMESALYFTAAEALTNVAKHSAAKHAVLSLTRTDLGGVVRTGDYPRVVDQS